MIKQHIFVTVQHSKAFYVLKRVMIKHNMNSANDFVQIQLQSTTFAVKTNAVDTHTHTHTHTQ